VFSVVLSWTLRGCIYIYIYIYIVTVDRVWIDNQIYWVLTDMWLQVIITVSLIHTLYCSLEHTYKSSQSAVSSAVLQ
jgi:hypothetical protein